jgi:hypothetical protein
VVAGLERVGPASVDDLVPVVYNDVDPSLHPWAKLSLLAHLLKLQVESRASVSDEFWRLTASG